MCFGFGCVLLISLEPILFISNTTYRHGCLTCKSPALIWSKPSFANIAYRFGADLSGSFQKMEESFVVSQ